MGGIPNNRFIIIERREKILIMLAEGLNEVEISNRLSVGQSTVCRDIKAIKKQSLNFMQSLNNVLPFEFGRSLVTVNQIIKEAWSIFNEKNSKWSNKDKINALKLIESATKTKFEILHGGPVYLQVQELQSKVKELSDIEIQESSLKQPDMLLHNGGEDTKPRDFNPKTYH